MIQQKVRKKKRPILMLIFSHSVKNHGTKITYTSQFVLMSCPYVLWDSKLGFVLFCQNQGICSHKIALIKKDCTRNRSSLPKVFCKKAVLKIFAKFTGKHLL